MRIAEHKQISTRTEKHIIHHAAEYDDDGNIIAVAWDETVEVLVPVMEVVNRDATPKEEAEFERQREEIPEPEPTEDERMEQIEAALIELAGMLAGGDA